MIIVTGPMGGGKSTVLDILENYGYRVVRADDIAKSLMDDSFFKIISDNFPKITDREKYKEEFFKDEKLKLFAEKLLHKKVYERIKELNPDFAEIPIYFETLDIKEEVNLNVNHVLYVTVDKDIRYKRLKKYRNFSIDEILEREKYFLDEAKKIKLSHYVINNNGDLKNLENEVRKYLACVK